MLIIDMLPDAESRALSYCQLSQITGLDQRELRKAIRSERRQGAAILTSRNGVWRWDGRDRNEFDACFRRMVQIGRDYVQTAVMMRAGQERSAVDG